MRLSLTLVAVLLASLVAGCIGAPGKTMTARDGLGDATDAAKAWGEGQDLQLIGIVAIEPFKRINHTSPDGSESGEFITHLDGNPGDGRAPGWVYGFLAGDRCVGVVLAAGLGVLAEGYETCAELGDLATDDSSDQVFVGDWSVDSDEAASRLHDHEEWPETGDDWTFFWALMPGDEDVGALWFVEGSGQDGLEVEAMVDAQSGEVLEINVENQDYGLFGPVEVGPEGAPGQDGQNGFTSVHAEAQPMVVAGVPESIEVELEGNGGYLIAQASVQASANIVGMMRVVLSGPDGVIEDEGLSNLGSSSATFEYGDLPPGTYTLSLEPNNVGAFAVQGRLTLDGGWN